MNITTLRLKTIGLGLAAVFAMIIVQVIAANPTFAATKTWDGGGGDSNFGTAANWNGDTLPATSGDNLVFPALGSNQTLVNNLNGTTTFTGVQITGANNYTIDSISLTTGTVQVSGAGSLTITAGLSSTGAMTLNGNNLLTIGSLTVSSGDLTVSSPFTATTANLAASAILSSAFSVTNTLTVGGALNVNQNITVGALDVATNLTISSSFTATNGFTVGGVLAMSGSPVITTTNGVIAVTGNATIAGTFTGNPSIDVTGVLTVSTSFTAASVSAGSIVVGASFNGGAIVSYANLDTLGFTVTATTLSLPNASTLTVSSGGSIVATTSVAVGDAGADTAAKITAVAGSTINTPSITIQGNAANASNLAGTLTGTPSISLPNGSLTLSSASTVGAVTVANVLTASNFTAAAVTTDTITIAGVFTVTGTLDVNSAATPLTVSAAIVVGTLDVAQDLTVSSAFTANTAVIVAGNLTTSAIITGVDTITVGGTATLGSTFSGSPAPTITVIGAATIGANLTALSITAASLTNSSSFTVTTLSVTGLLTLNAGMTATTVTAGSLTNSSSFTVSGVLTVTGALTANTGFTALTVTTGTLTTSSAITVTGVLTVNGALTITNAHTVGTLNALAGLTISNVSGTFTASTVINVTGDLAASASYSAPTVNVSGNVTLTGFHSSGGHKYVVGGTMLIGDGNSSSTVYLSTDSAITGVVTVETYGTLRYVTSATGISLGGLVVKNNATVYLEGTITYPVTFGSGTSTGAPSLGFNNSSSYIVDGNGYTIYTILKFTGAVTLANDLQLSITGNAYSGVIEFAGTLTYNNYTIRKSATTSGTLVIGGVEVRNPASVNEYTGDLPGNSVTVGDNDVAVITGTRGSVTAYRGGFVKGTGQIVNLNLQYGSTVSPGNSPGKLTVLNTLTFSTGSTYYAELLSTSAYDQLAVGEEYTLFGNPIALNNATLNVVLSSGYKIAQGDKFTIIDNKSSRPVSGTFLNQPEGSVFSVGDGTFSITYAGGDGNDVVITTVSAPSQPVQAPNTGFRPLTSNPALLLGLGVVTAGFFLVMASRRRANSTL